MCPQVGWGGCAPKAQLGLLCAGPMGAAKTREFDDRPRAASGPAASAVAAQASRILSSATFQKSRRVSRFLAYAVENTLAGKESVLKETVLGIEVFDRGPGSERSSLLSAREMKWVLRQRLPTVTVSNALTFSSVGLPASIVDRSMKPSAARLTSSGFSRCTRGRMRRGEAPLEDRFSSLPLRQLRRSSRHEGPVVSSRRLPRGLPPCNE